jgi:hypothetical protein
MGYEKLKTLPLPGIYLWRPRKNSQYVHKIIVGNGIAKTEHGGFWPACVALQGWFGDKIDESAKRGEV